ncbi:MAG: hypothetical protein ACK5GD_14840 [Planctomycetota bacterium]
MQIIHKLLLALLSSIALAPAALSFQPPDQNVNRYSEPRFPKERIPMWKQVEDAIAKGLPKSAIEKLDQIIEQTLQNKAFPEAALAMARKIRIESEIQGSDPAEAITRMQNSLEKAPDQVKPALHAILGHWYWSYFEANRWRFQKRTALADESSQDIKTWDLKRIFREIDKQYTSSLANSDTLKSTPINTFDALLDPGTYPDSYRPTLYDFLAHQAIEFYASGEQAGVQREDALKSMQTHLRSARPKTF